MNEKARVVDRDLVKGIDGRPGRLEELYVRHIPEATRLAFLMTHDASIAEDVAQDAIVKIAGRLGHLRTPAAFSAYLRRTVVNLCISHHRHEAVARAFLKRESARSVGRHQAIELPDLETHDELRAAL